MKWVALGIIVLSTSAADLLKSSGMRQHGEVHDFRPGALRKAFLAIAQNRFILAGVLADFVSFLAFMALLSMAELSFAVPSTASIFVVETVCAKILLRESVTWKRWVGVAFIVCGISLLSV